MRPNFEPLAWPKMNVWYQVLVEKEGNYETIKARERERDLPLIWAVQKFCRQGLQLVSLGRGLALIHI